MRLNSRKGWLCAIISVSALTAGAYADDLLVVDLTVTDQVTISATSGLSAVTTSGSDTTGIYLEDFFGGVTPTGIAETLVSGDLTNAENPSDGTPDLFSVDPGLNIWSFSSDTTVSFTAGSLAFVGSATWDLDATTYAEMLAGNTSGNLWFPADTVDDIASAQMLGTWYVIPEPGTLSLLGIGLAMGLLRRRR